MTIRSWTLAFLLLLLSGPPLMAATVANLYAAEVDLPGGSNGLNAAFDTALSRVLVKVSGLPELGNAGARAGLTRDVGKLVRKYSMRAGNRVYVEFDAAAVNNLLDSAGHPVWGANRPLVAVWLAVDEGGGRRSLVASGDGGRSGGRLDRLRSAVSESAEARGLPIVFPLVDAEDMRAVSVSDVWGNFREPVFEASRRYGAEAILIGRAEGNTVRWSLDTGRERNSWQGSVADGPRVAAETLAQALATFAGASDTVRVSISAIDTLEKFGRVRNFLRTLDVIESASISRVDGDRVEFNLVVRGDATRLSRSLESGRLLARAAPGDNLAGNALEYAWVGSR